MIPSKTSHSFPGLGHIQLVCQKLKEILISELKIFHFYQTSWICKIVDLYAEFIFDMMEYLTFNDFLKLPILIFTPEKWPF